MKKPKKSKKSLKKEKNNDREEKSELKTLIIEHRRLIKVLKKGNHSEQLKEARKQQSDLNKYLKEYSHEVKENANEDD